MDHNRINYEALAPIYARYREASPRILRYLTDAARGYDRPALLDVGCGTGDFPAALTETLATAGGSCLGFDVSPAMLEKATAKHGGSLKLSLGDAAGRWPYGDGEFDMVFSVNFIHYIPAGGLRHFFAEARRVLKPGGMVITVTDSEEDIANRTMTRYFPETVEHELRRYHPISRIEAAMREAGFREAGADHTRHEGEMTPADVDRYRNRIFSALRLISDFSFVTGMARLERDFGAGRRSLVELYTYVKGKA